MQCILEAGTSDGVLTMIAVKYGGHECASSDRTIRELLAIIETARDTSHELDLTKSHAMLSQPAGGAEARAGIDGASVRGSAANDEQLQLSNSAHYSDRPLLHQVRLAMRIEAPRLCTYVCAQWSTEKAKVNVLSPNRPFHLLLHAKQAANVDCVFTRGSTLFKEAIVMPFLAWAYSSQEQEDVSWYPDVDVRQLQQAIWMLIFPDVVLFI